MVARRHHSGSLGTKVCCGNAVSNKFLTARIRVSDCRKCKLLPHILYCLSDISPVKKPDILSMIAKSDIH